MVPAIKTGCVSARPIINAPVPIKTMLVLAEISASRLGEVNSKWDVEYTADGNMIRKITVDISSLIDHSDWDC